MSFNFKIQKNLKNSNARATEIEINGNVIQTPVFMPVGTQASVKTLTPEDLENIGAQIILANTYHLFLRPGADTIKQLGGLHNLMNWKKPILTDSGGFQVFSLGYGIEHGVGKIANIFPSEVGGVLNNPSIKQDIAGEYSDSSNSLIIKQKAQLPTFDPKLAKIYEDGVIFTSHLDGQKYDFNAKVSVETQIKLGGDIILCFDECPSPLHDKQYTQKALERTHRWEVQSLEVYEELESKKFLTKPFDKLNSYPYPHSQYLFGIPHGGAYQDLRTKSAKFISDLDVYGFSIGGSMGKSKQDMHQILEWTMSSLDRDRPRHLLGIGDVDDVFECIERGIDMFDCVAPTRIARNGALLISPEQGGNKANKFRLIITNSQFDLDQNPIDKSCNCYTCQNFSRAYLNHLFRAKELLAYRLATIHNLYFMVNLVKKIRQSTLDDNFHQLKSKWLG